MWWLPIDPDDTRLVGGEIVDLDRFVSWRDAALRLDHEYPLREQQELWIYERQFRRVSGLAHVARVAYRYRSQWWMDLTVDPNATRALSRQPLYCEGKVMRREPWKYGEADPWLVDMHEGDLSIVRTHLAAVTARRGPLAADA
jgi:hypothetical protein